MTLSLRNCAILSVADKTGIEQIARVLHDQGIALYATGGTGTYLRDNGIEAGDIADLTGQPAMLDGRVKALHPAIFAGLLAREDDSEELAAHGYAAIGFLIAGIAPFAPDAANLSSMDIGGPAMIRAAIKTHERLVLATHPEDYDAIIAALCEGDGVGPDLRQRLARRAMERLLDYDASVLRCLEGPDTRAYPVPHLQRGVPLRYGENPHQAGTLYLTASGAPGAARAERAQGKMPSFTNVLDADAAFELARRFEHPAAVIVKHGAPCGVALGDTPRKAYLRALAADPQSAFGGTIGFNRVVDANAMESLVERFTEAVIAPGFAEDALCAAARRPQMRVLRVNDLPEAAGEMDVRSVTGGLLVQTCDRLRIARADLTPVTVGHPTEAEIDDMLLALEVVRFVKSNAVVTASAGATVGIGGGQSSRVGAVELAVRDCAQRAGGRGLVLASDAYFPFPDSLEVAAKAGVSAIVQQGGGKNDHDVIAAANRLGVSMLFTGVRLFRH